MPRKIFFSLNQSIFFFLSSESTYLLSNSLNPNFPIHSLQIRCIGLFGPKFIHHLGKGPKLHPYTIHIHGITSYFCLKNKNKNDQNGEENGRMQLIYIYIIYYI